MKLLVLNGPNLNLLGNREPEVYGSTDLSAINSQLEKTFPEISFEFFQSNHEGDLVDRLQKAEGPFDGIILNAGAFTHYSYAIRDAVASISVPVVEVHISNIAGREDFRRESVLSAVCAGTIFGFGVKGYTLAVQSFKS